MQWDGTKHAGFTSGEPWIGLNPNFEKGINVKAQEEAAESVLQYFRKMVKMRKDHLTLVYGDYQLLLEEHEDIYAYTRTLGKESILVLLSFSTEPVSVNIDEINAKELELLISNMPEHAEDNKTDFRFSVRPYQCMVYKILD